MAQDPQVVQLLTDTAGSLIHSEALAASGSAIIPGMLVEETATGEVQEVSAAANAQKLVALSDLATAGTIDTVYPEGTTVRYGAGHSGQEVYLWVATGAGAIAVGGPLAAVAGGTVGPSATNVIAYALEALTNTSGSNARIRARLA